MDYSFIKGRGFFEAGLFAVSKKFEVIEFFLLAVFAFVIPLLFHDSQLFTGTIVNCLLVVAAINARGWKKILSLVTLPSLSVLAGGFFFGAQSVFLLYLLPFIWLGNAMIVFLFRSLFVQRRDNFFRTIAIAAFLKTALLFAAAFCLYSLSFVPAIFLTAMGIMQFASALAGGLAAFPVFLAYRKAFSFNSNNW